MTESTTEHLARFAASVKYEDIPAPAREYCKDILLDTVACAFAGHLGEETDQIARFAKSLATSTESAVIGAIIFTRRRDAAQWLSHYGGNDVRHSPFDTHARNAGSRPARLIDWRT